MGGMYSVSCIYVGMLPSPSSPPSFLSLLSPLPPPQDKACAHAVGSRSYMESLMCLESLPQDRVITQAMCYPTVEGIVADIASVLSDTGIRAVYVGSDVTPPLGVIREGLGDTVRPHMYCMVGSVCVKFICAK